MPKDLTIGIDELIPDPKNARRHSPKNIGAIESSIRAFGPARSIVIDGNGVVRAGNGTLEAAKRAGVKNVRIVHSTGEELVAVVRDDLSDAQAAAYALADNRASDLSEWDPKALQTAVEELTEAGAVLSDFGFSEGDFTGMFPPEKADPESPDEFKEVGEDLETDKSCPKCGYRWS